MSSTELICGGRSCYVPGSIKMMDVQIPVVEIPGSSGLVDSSFEISTCVKTRPRHHLPTEPLILLLQFGLTYLPYLREDEAAMPPWLELAQESVQRLQLAAVELDQPPIREEHLCAHGRQKRQDR